MPGAGGLLDQDPYWLALVSEYRMYRMAYRYWSQGTKGVERIMRLPERERDVVIDLLVEMRRAQGLPMDSEGVFAEMHANDPEDAEDE